jgi:alanine dehydrogenase
MIIGIPKETKVEEYRVGAPPMAVESLTQAGHNVVVQSTAGEGTGFNDEEYVKVGATIAKTAEELYDQAEMIYQVKEPIPPEFPLLKKGQIHFRYLHLAAEEELTRTLIDRGVTAVAFETIELSNGTLPLLDPMSAVAGRVGTLVGAQYLGRMHNGNGKLISGVPGVPPATVVILGGGVVGTNAADMAVGLGARVIMITRNLTRLRYLEDKYHGRFETLASNPYNIANAVKEADILIGGVLVPGARAPKIVTREMVKTMRSGSVIVDVAIDQGGCCETSRPTTHADPIYTIDGVIHYCVTNMPGIYPRTSAIALSNATLPYALKLANMGLREAVLSDETLAKGVNIYDGHVTYEGVAEAFGLEHTPVAQLLK